MDTAVPSLLHAIRAYYDRTWFDYRVVWLDYENLAFHFGYYGDGVQSHREALLNTNATLARLAAVRPDDRVMDAGCGVGGSAFWLAEKLGARVVGMNIVPGQIERARALAEARGVADRVEFCNADYANTGWPDESFDVVWALESLCHAPDKHAFYREAYRVLKPGGRLIIAEYMLQRAPSSYRDVRLVDEWLQGWSMPNLYEGSQHSEAATAAGFKDVSVTDYTRHVRRSLARLFAMSVFAVLPSELFYRLGLRCAVQRGNIIASLRQYQALARGLWFYGLLSAVKR